MGIRGLGSWIKWAAKHTIQKPDWQDWKGKTIGVDILGLLYNAKSKKQCPFQYLGKLSVACKRYDITIVPIFDGKPPIEKHDTLQQRSDTRVSNIEKRDSLQNDLNASEVSDQQRKIVELEIQKLDTGSIFLTSEEREKAKQLMYACGILSLNASGEADNVLAYLAKRGVIQAVISNDFDLLARGVENLLVPEAFALPGDSSGWAQYSLSNILKAVHFEYEQFLEMSVLMGCDYTPKKKRLPYRSAFWAIKYSGSLEKILHTNHIRDSTQYRKAITLFRGEHETKESLMGEKQWLKLSGGSPKNEIEALHLFRSSMLKELTEEEFCILTNTTLVQPLSCCEG